MMSPADGAPGFAQRHGKWNTPSGDRDGGNRLNLVGRGTAVVLLAVLLAGCWADAPPGPAARSLAAGAAADGTAEQAPPGDGFNTAPADESRSSLAGAEGSARYALVFGNGAYRHGDALAAPARDAALIARALNGRGYHVMVGIDRDLAGMREDIAAFQSMSRDAELRLLYFAGHGFEFDSANYLMPVDLPAAITDLSEQDVHINALRLDQLVFELEQDAPVLVAVIDACRVPPTRGGAGLPGLAEEQPPEGAILAFATAPGRVAMDSLRAYGVDQEHSPYSYYLASALASPDVETWDQAFGVAYNIVNDRTRGAQQPWMNARVNRFPAIGALQQAAAAAGPGPLARYTVSPERSAAGRYWADESLATLQLAADRTTPDARLQARAAEGEVRASIALARRWSGENGREREVMELLEPIAEQGNAVAQMDLGNLLYTMAGEDGAGRSARYWWAQASAQGIGEARAKLAIVDGDAEAAMDEVIRGFGEHFKAFAPRLEDMQ